jgi:hypothetical protein
MISPVTDLDACGANGARRVLLQPIQLEGAAGVNRWRIRTLQSHGSSFGGGLTFRLSPPAVIT